MPETEGRELNLGYRGALDGITVLDLGQAFMGPYCGFVLQRLGADVIKVEPPEGEPYRRPSVRTKKQGIQFGLFNAGKRSLAIDLKHPEGRQTFARLAETVDVVLQNFAPGTFERLVDVDALLEANPALIVASGSGYGSGGPYGDLKGMDLTIQAMSGVMATTGFPDGPPIRTGPAVVDILGGAHLAAAILAALVQRSVTGEGQRVEVSLYDAVFPSLASNIAGYLDSAGEIPERTGNRHGALAVAPYNAYPTTDGSVAILCLHDRHFRALCAAMGRPDLVEEDDFETSAERAVHMDRLDGIVGSWTTQHTSQEVFTFLTAADVPCAPVMSLEEVLADPQVVERKLLEHHLRGDDDWWTFFSPLRLAGSPQPQGSVPPGIGEHSVEVLASRLGLSGGEMEAMVTAGVIRDGDSNRMRSDGSSG